MATKKYDYYILSADSGEAGETFEDYRDAFRGYRRAEGPKTLYGVEVEGGRHIVVFSE